MKPVIERTEVTARCPGGHEWETTILPGSTMPQTGSCPTCDMLVRRGFNRRLAKNEQVVGVRIGADIYVGLFRWNAAEMIRAHRGMSRLLGRKPKDIAVIKWACPHCARLDERGQCHNWDCAFRLGASLATEYTVGY